MLKNPCRNHKTKEDCPDRHVGCHTTCDKWRRYEEIRNTEYMYRKEYMESNYMYKNKYGR